MLIIVAIMVSIKRICRYTKYFAHYTPVAVIVNAIRSPSISYLPYRKQYAPHVTS